MALENENSICNSDGSAAAQALNATAKVGLWQGNEMLSSCVHVVDSIVKSALAQRTGRTAERQNQL